MDDQLLKQRIRDLVDKLPNKTRSDVFEEIFSLVKEYQLAETKDGIISLFDLNRIHEITLSTYQGISLPFCVGGKQTNEHQRKAYCYLIGSVSVLHRLGLLNRNIHANLDQPFYEPIDD